MMKAAATFVVQWAHQMPNDDVLTAQWTCAVDGGEPLRICEAADIEIERTPTLTELRSIVMYGPVSATPATVRQQLQCEVAILADRLGATDCAVLEIVYGTRFIDLDRLATKLTKSDQVNRVLPILDEAIDDVTLPLATRKQVDMVRAQLYSLGGR